MNGIGYFFPCRCLFFAVQTRNARIAQTVWRRRSTFGNNKARTRTLPFSTCSTMAPAIMGSPERPELSEELTNSFCRTDPEIAKHFARATFLSDHRSDFGLVTTPSLVLQCSDDLIAPLSVGTFLERTMPACTLRIIQNVGHCPHISAPSASLDAMNEFLAA